jgi:hypothetical protein
VFTAMLSANLAARCGSVADRTGKADLRDAFTIRADVVDALEGGPIVLKVTLRCQLGRDCPTGPYLAARHWHIKNGIPPGWRSAYLVKGSHGLIPYVTLIDQSQELEDVHYIHWSYKNIKSGKHRFTLSWPVYLKDMRNRIASPVTTVELMIDPADEKHLSALCDRLQSRLAKASEDEQAISAVLNTLSFTSHRSLAPVAWKLLEITPEHHARFFPRILSVLDDLDSRPHIDERLVHFVNGPNNWRAVAIFHYWSERHERISDDVLQKWLSSDTIEIEQPRPEPLSPAAFAALLRSQRLWTRVLTYVHFSKHCEKPWVYNLLSDFKNLQRPIPVDRFNRLLRDLDDDSFAVREKASVQLEQFGERVESQLHQALQTHLSPEAKRRVRFILERIAAAKEAPEWKPILEHIASGGGDKEAAVAVLRALAKGTPDAALTKAAVASLNKLSARK